MYALDCIDIVVDIIDVKKKYIQCCMLLYTKRQYTFIPTSLFCDCLLIKGFYGKNNCTIIYILYKFA